jgi:hypothetical protein
VFGAAEMQTRFYMFYAIETKTGQWFSPNTSVSSTNKTDRHDIIEILLKVMLNTINPLLNFPRID